MSKQRSPKTPYWLAKPIEKLNQDEWEGLCDGCGKCCLHKLEDEDTNIVYYTNVVCRLLDNDTCRCGDYLNRVSRVKDCLVLTAQSLKDCEWLPSTCSYRLIAEGKPLPAWHHLVCGDVNEIHRADMSVRDKVVSEVDDIEDLQLHIVEWPI